MTTWFTSDWHLSHRNIIKYSNRPFENVDEMDDTIISNHNNLVKEGDDVYYLGDLTFKKHMIEDFMSQIKGRIYFILGNHDRGSRHILKRYCEGVWEFKEIKVEGQSITLCHYPLYTHNKSHYNAWCLYGHHHREVEEVQGKKMNVGVDVNDFKPVSFEQVSEFMSYREDNFDLIRDRRR